MDDELEVTTADEMEVVGLMKEEGLFGDELSRLVSNRQGHDKACMKVPCRHVWKWLLHRLLSIAMSTQALTDLDELRLDVFDIENAKLWPDGTVQKDVGLVTNPENRWRRCLGSEGRSYLVHLLGVRLDVLIRR